LARAAAQDGRAFQTTDPDPGRYDDGSVCFALHTVGIYLFENFALRLFSLSFKRYIGAALLCQCLQCWISAVVLFTGL
jgi:hypothetical protein